MLNATTRVGNGEFRLTGDWMSFVRFHHTSGQPDGFDALRSTNFTGTLSLIGDRSLRGAEMVCRADPEMMQPQKMKGSDHPSSVIFAPKSRKDALVDGIVR